MNESLTHSRARAVLYALILAAAFVAACYLIAIVQHRQAPPGRADIELRALNVSQT